MSLLVFYLLASWLPLLITTAGFSMEHASLMGATLTAGGTVGAVLIGRLMDRFEPHLVLAGAYLVAGAFVMLLGSAVATPWLLVLAIFGAGFGVAGAQVGVNALAAGYYPTESRATGVSCLSRETALAMVFRLAKSAERHWRRLDGANRLGQLIEGIRFRDGKAVQDAEEQAAA